MLAWASIHYLPYVFVSMRPERASPMTMDNDISGSQCTSLQLVCLWLGTIGFAILCIVLVLSRPVNLLPLVIFLIMTAAGVFRLVFHYRK